jgi:hypothetical protein
MSVFNLAQKQSFPPLCKERFLNFTRNYRYNFDINIDIDINSRPRKDHFKNDLRSDQDHLLKIIFFQRNYLDLDLRSCIDHFWPKSHPF